MSRLSQISFVLILAVVAYTTVLAKPQKYPGYPSEHAAYPNEYRPLSKPYSGYQPIGHHSEGYLPGGDIGVRPALLNDIYQLLHEIFGCLHGHRAALGRFGVLPEVLNRMDTLVEQLLMSSVPCGAFKNQGLALDLLDSLSDLLNRLLYSSKGGIGGAGRIVEDIGAVPDFLNRLIQVLQDLLTGDFGSSRFGGARSTPELCLKALDTLLRELLASQREQCSLSEHGLAPRPYRGNLGYPENIGYHEDIGYPEHTGHHRGLEYRDNYEYSEGTRYEGNNKFHGNAGYGRNPGYLETQESLGYIRSY